MKIHPVLFHVGSFPIYSYSVFVVLAYLAGLLYAWEEAKREGQDPALVADISLWLFVGGIVGARLFFVLVAYQVFLASPLNIFKLWQGGLVFYGGLFGAVVAGLIFIRRHALPVGFWLDLLAPVAMVALGVGRIGCFLNGCCYGKPAPSLPDFFMYPLSHPALGLLQVPIHPVQLYESFLVFLFFLFLVWFRRRGPQPGMVFWTMVLGYAVIRFGLEYFRFDPRGKIPFFNLSTSQAISVVAALVSLAMLLALFRRSQEAK